MGSRQSLLLISVILRTFHAGGIPAADEGSHDIFRITAAASFFIGHGMYHFGGVGRTPVIIVLCIFQIHGKPPFSNPVIRLPEPPEFFPGTG